MKTFQYWFHGIVTVKLDGNNKLLELTQEINQSRIIVRGDTIYFNSDTVNQTYPNSLEGLRDVYNQCGFLVEFIDNPLCVRIKVIQDEYKKELIYDKTNHNFISILDDGKDRVMLSTSSTGWNCTVVMNNDVNTTRGDAIDMNACLFEYAAKLQTVFPMVIH